MLHELIPDEEHSVPTRQGSVHAHEPASEVDERVDVHPGTGGEGRQWRPTLPSIVDIWLETGDWFKLTAIKTNTNTLLRKVGIEIYIYRTSK